MQGTAVKNVETATNSRANRADERSGNPTPMFDLLTTRLRVDN
jgi:hypothetical protein